ncbi:glycosyltransferase family 2 protein [Streptomyces sp. NPDC048845]|uniref:glycosyltransferase family 2 protein n=1 Tax=Streptomyces sp. NPDC048845 TaxID=3155390 RepID=UPI0034324FBF
MGEPDVTVVIGAYEAMPYLVRCLESVEAQSIGADRMEIVAVDDGSTDGTGEYLGRFAAESKIPTRVVRQENSGGPSGPRNTGLKMARGRYVFFLDADDYLGDEAFERMVAMADRNGTDVVLGKVVGVNRGAPKSMWARNLERTDVFSSNIKFTLSAQKLFRRELLTRHGMTFREDLRTGEDAVFTMEAYLRADGVSVVADHVCYHLVGRDDGKHVTKSGSYVLRFDSARAQMETIASLVPAGPRRDSLMVRPVVVTLLPQFGPVLLKQSERIQRHKIELARPLLDAYWTRGLARGLRAHERLRLHCVSQGRLDQLLDVVAFVRDKKPPKVVLDARRRTAYLALPFFRDPAAGIPDRVYAATRETLSAADLVWEGGLPWRSRVRGAARRLLGPRLSRRVGRLAGRRPAA